MKKILLALSLMMPSMAEAYTVIIPAPNAPAGTEQQLIAETTTFFNAFVTINPLFPNTYQINLLGPAISTFPVLVDSGTYSFVYSQGMLDERSRDLGNMTGPITDCSQSPFCLNVSSITSPGNFKTFGSTYTVTIDSATCQAVVCAIAGNIYLQNYSPPIINGP